MTTGTTASKQQFWLIRGIDQKQSLMFSICVEIERDADTGLYSAIVAGMDDQMAATGRDVDEAGANARLLFKAVVDDALRKKASISFATGQSPLTLDLPIWMAPKFIHMLERSLMEHDDEPETQWLWSLSDASQTLDHVV